MKGGISILVHWKYMVGPRIKPRTPATLARSSTTELLWSISMVHIHVATTNTEQSFTKRFYFNLWKNSLIFIVLLLALFIRKPIKHWEIWYIPEQKRNKIIGIKWTSNHTPATWTTNLIKPLDLVYLNSLAKARYTTSNCGTNRTLVDKFE